MSKQLKGYLPFNCLPGENVSYTYDAWGNVTTTYHNGGASTTARYNPFKYRGYYHDSELGFYYLNSRYYDPAIGRWINADSQLNTSLGILGLNQFSYCLNNPVNMVDYGGNKPGDLFNTMDEAARDAAIHLGALSFKNGWEYGTAIYTVLKIEKISIPFKIKHRFFFLTWTTNHNITIRILVEKYTYTAVKTNKDPWGVSIPNAPLFKNRVATLHTHPMGSGRGITKFSDYYENGKRKGDIINSINRGIPSYVHGPNGVLRKYDPSTGKDVVVFSDLPISPKKPWLYD